MRSEEKMPPENPQPPTAETARAARMLTPVTLPDDERLRRYDKLVQTLLMNCPLGTTPSPGRARRWKRAYNTLFRVASLKVEVQSGPQYGPVR